MKRLHLLLLATATAAIIGCGSGESEVTATDKNNLERLHKEGIGKVMADDAAKNNKPAPSLANPDGSAGPESKGP